MVGTLTMVCLGAIAVDALANFEAMVDLNSLDQAMIEMMSIEAKIETDSLMMNEAMIDLHALMRIDAMAVVEQ